MTGGRRRAATHQLLAAYSSVVLNIVNGIVLVPYYFKYFDVATYGSWLACQNVVTWLGLLELGFNLVFTHRLVQDASSKERFPETVGSGLAVTFVTVGLAAAVGVALAGTGRLWMPVLLGARPENLNGLRAALAFAALGAALTMSQAAFTAMAASWLDAGRTGAIAVVALACGIATTFVALFAGAGVVALGLSALVRGATGAVGAGVYVAIQYKKRGYASVRASKRAVAELGRAIALPGAARVFSTMASNSDATVAAAILGPTAAAILGISSRLYDVGRLLLVPISYSVFSPFADVFMREGAARARALYKELIAVVLGLSTLLIPPAIALNASFVRVWLGKNVYAGETVSVALGLATFAYTFANLQTVLIAALGRIREGAMISVLETVVRVTVLLALTHVIGIAGVPLSTLAASAVTIALCYRVLRGGLEARSGAELLVAPRLIAFVIASFAASVFARVVVPADGWRWLIVLGAACSFVAVAFTAAVSTELRYYAKAAVARLAGAREKA